MAARVTIDLQRDNTLGISNNYVEVSFQIRGAYILSMFADIAYEREFWDTMSDTQWSNLSSIIAEALESLDEVVEG